MGTRTLKRIVTVFMFFMVTATLGETPVEKDQNHTEATAPQANTSNASASNSTQRAQPLVLPSNSLLPEFKAATFRTLVNGILKDRPVEQQRTLLSTLSKQSTLAGGNEAEKVKSLIQTAGNGLNDNEKKILETEGLRVLGNAEGVRLAFEDLLKGLPGNQGAADPFQSQVKQPDGAEKGEGKKDLAKKNPEVEALQKQIEGLLKARNDGSNDLGKALDKALNDANKRNAQNNIDPNANLNPNANAATPSAAANTGAGQTGNRNRDGFANKLKDALKGLKKDAQPLHFPETKENPEAAAKAQYDDKKGRGISLGSGRGVDKEAQKESQKQSDEKVKTLKDQMLAKLGLGDSQKVSNPTEGESAVANPVSGGEALPTSVPQRMEPPSSAISAGAFDSFSAGGGNEGFGNTPVVGKSQNGGGILDGGIGSGDVFSSVGNTQGYGGDSPNSQKFQYAKGQEVMAGNAYEGSLDEFGDGDEEGFEGDNAPLAAKKVFPAAQILSLPKGARDRHRVELPGTVFGKTSEVLRGLLQKKAVSSRI